MSQISRNAMRVSAGLAGLLTLATLGACSSGDSGASTEKYGELQKKSAELVQNAKSIAQFLDRDTNADLANTVITASLQEFIKNPSDIDAITASIQQQAASILG